MPFDRKTLTTPRHRSAYLEAGPPDGPLIIFVHGFPEAPLVWHEQIAHFAGAGWHCVAPWMRGYGASAVPQNIAAYAVRESVADMVELHDALGGAPAVWVGHDWGAPVVWAMASHHRTRCRGVANLCIPYFARGFALPSFVPLVDRTLYPVNRFPVGQWDYWLHFREHFTPAVRQLENDATGTLRMLFQHAEEPKREPAFSATTRERGGLFGGIDTSAAPADNVSLHSAMLDEMARDLVANGFSGPVSWYMNDDANLAYAREAPDFGRLTLPVLFLHGRRDPVCETVESELAAPMREDCVDLTEAVIDGGHHLALERPGETNRAIKDWLIARVNSLLH
jgi:pimeloyl-ACP methyl ester carboxylesterase